MTSWNCLLPSAAGTGIGGVGTKISNRANLHQSRLHATQDPLGAAAEHRLLLPADVVLENLGGLDTRLRADVPQRGVPADRVRVEQVASRTTQLDAPKHGA